MHITCLDETRCNAGLANESHKRHAKAQYEKKFKPCFLSEGGMVLLHDQEADKLGVGKFQPMWLCSYIFKRFLAKGAYKLVYFDAVPLLQPRNGLYLKKYYD